MKRIFGFILMSWMAVSANAQHLLTLDSCRALALNNNKQLGISRVKQEVAANLRKSAHTKYLPHVNALGGYEWFSKEISILNSDQKSMLSNLGTNLVGGIQNKVGTALQSLPVSVWQELGQHGYTPAGIQQSLGTEFQGVADALNARGQQVVDAFRTDTRNIFAGAILVTQPIYMGGAITALNNMAAVGEQLAVNSTESKRQATLYQIDQTYWQVVSLCHKKKLAESYLELVKKFDGDVQKMIAEGVATRSQGLSVAVKVNEAEMALQQVEDGLVLSKMLLCELCGLPVDDQVKLADEETSALHATVEPSAATAEQVGMAMENRPELKMLQNMVDLSKETTHLLKAGNLPKVALTGGYAISNPNVYDGFHKKFSGIWNVGVLVHVPIWNWGDVAYKVRASKAATTIATLELDEAREKIELQVNQSGFKVKEASRRLTMAEASCRRADENLRTANIGFSEGVISSTTVMEAQTAWLQAQSQKIDAEIEVKLSQINLRKSLGVLSEK